MTRQRTDQFNGGRLFDGQGRRQVVLTDVGAAPQATDLLEGGQLYDGDGREYLAVASNQSATAATPADGTVTDAKIAPTSRVKVVTNAPLNPMYPEYGAKFDGVTDDTAAFNACLTAAGFGGRIHLPPGTAIVKDLLPATNGQRIVGCGKYSTILKAGAGAAYVLKFVGQTDMGVADLRIDGNGLASAGLRISSSASVGAQSCSVERVNFHNCTRGVDVPNPGAVNQADKNTYYDCVWDGCTQGMNIAAPNGQEQVLINPNFASIGDTAIDISGGSLILQGGQIQSVAGSGYGIHVTGANVQWIALDDVITEGTLTDIRLENPVAWGIRLIQCNLQGTNYCVDPGAASGVLLYALMCRFNTGAVGRATANDFTFVDVMNSFLTGSAWVPSTTYPRRTRFTLPSEAGSVEGLVLDSYQSKFKSPYGANTVALITDGQIQIGASGTPIQNHISATTTWDPPSVAAGAQTTTTVTATNAAVGDTVTVGFNKDLQGMQLTGYVSAANTVTVVLRNGTAGAIDLASGTLRVDVWQH